MIVERPFHLEQQVRKIDLLFRQNMTAPLINTVMASVFLFFGWSTIPHSFLIPWAVTFILFSFVRIVATFRWMKIKAFISSEKELKKWHRLLVVLLFIGGTFFGLMGAASALYLKGVPETSVGMLILGTVAASVAVYAPSLACSLAFLLPATLIWAASALWVGGLYIYIMAAMVLFFCLIQIRLALNWYNYAQKTIATNSDLHEKEERLRHNRDASDAVDWDWNLETDEFACEGNLEFLFGTRGRIFRGNRRDYLDRIHPLDRELLSLAMDQAIETGSLDAEHKVIWPDGQTQFIAMRGRIQKNREGRPMCMRGICWNITAKKVEEQLRHERDLYEAADKAKLMFLANASHEIRTPLSAINGFAELVLSRAELSEQVQNDLKIILRNGRYLASIVNDLLDLSKSEADHLYIQKSSMSPLREINDSLLVVQATAKQKGLQIKTVYETPVPEIIHSDPTRFRQILINLLTNAVKYTNEGAATVYISYVSQAPKPFLRIVVSDTGIGINEETRKNLFQPFVRGQNREVQRVSGSGLGLALSRSLARKMGGDLRLLTTPATSEKGSQFEFIVETGSLAGVHLVHAEKAATASLDEKIKASTPGRLLGQNILLAEDQADLRELMQRYLEKHGAKVTTCVDGAETVAEAMRASYDVILMDIQMPVMDGYQATRLLRERGYEKPVVALTAHASAMDRQKCYDVGCNFYLSKPVNITYLLDVLTRRMSDGTWPADSNRTSH